MALGSLRGSLGELLGAPLVRMFRFLDVSWLLLTSFCLGRFLKAAFRCYFAPGASEASPRGLLSLAFSGFP